MPLKESQVLGSGQIAVVLRVSRCRDNARYGRPGRGHATRTCVVLGREGRVAVQGQILAAWGCLLFFLIQETLMVLRLK